ncbi:hypothetical protein SAMN05216588_10153 [Pseudomonas flavescens]|uniref:Uncharacterized protein n=1 Tax=Phytopseudomonas flavescens TaxID=29435 RepID=A0A1G7XB88_9GAMM|nr:hypothetical protein [Pseudomonas flavescens]SDG81466.1 hypothetical protein SAMN05216588_10153 [Pseudomonas flavescens]
MEVLSTITGFIVEVVFRALGLWVLKCLTGGRYNDTNSYLYFFPGFVGFLLLVVLIVLVVAAASWIRQVIGP